jgi:hypothetical protein
MRHPGFEIRLIVRKHIRGETLPACHVCQIRRDDPSGASSPHGVAIRAWRRQKDFLPLNLLRSGRLRCSLDHVSSPSFVGFGLLGDDDNGHVRVLRAAVLRTLTTEDTLLSCLKTEMVDIARNHVHLPLKLGNPKGMEDVRGFQRDIYGASYWNVNLVGSRELPIDRPPIYCTSHHHWCPITRMSGAALFELLWS